MTLENIISEVKNGKISPIYFLHGEEAFFIDQLSDFFQDKLLTEEESVFNKMILYGKDVDVKAITDEALQFPMMSRFRLIIIKEAQEMKKLLELEDYINRPNPSTILVICHKHKKFDKRTKFAKVLANKAIVFESTKVNSSKLVAWTSQYAKSIGLQFEASAAELLVEYLGLDLSKIANELQKLKLVVEEGKKLDETLIKEFIGLSNEFTIFDLQKVIGNKDVGRSRLMIEQFIKNPKLHELVILIPNLFSYFNKILIVHFNQKDNDVVLGKKLNVVFDSYVKDHRAAASKYTLPHLIQIFEALKRAEYYSKGVGSRNLEYGSILKDILISTMHIKAN